MNQLAAIESKELQIFTPKDIRYDRKTRKFLTLGQQTDYLQKLIDTFHPVDVVEELKKMALWLDREENSRRKGTRKFIESWLGRAKNNNNQYNQQPRQTFYSQTKAQKADDADHRYKGLESANAETLSNWGFS